MASFFLSCTTSPVKEVSSGQYYPLPLSSIETDDLGQAVHLEKIQGFGPEKLNPKSDQKNSKEQIKNLIVGISFGPGLNRVAAQISFLKSLERHNLKAQIFSGVEMGAIIAALYSITGSAEKLEWFFYRFFRKAQNLKPYSSKWLTSVKEDLLDPALKGRCKEMRIESLKSFIFIPVYNRKTRKLEYKTSGNLCQSLLDNLNPYPSQKSNYVSALGRTTFAAKQLKSHGVDFLIGVDVLDSNVKFNNASGELLGIHLQAMAKVKNEMPLLDYFVSLPTSEADLDTKNDLALIQRKSFEHTESIIDELLFEIKSFKDHNNR